MYSGVNMPELNDSNRNKIEKYQSRRQWNSLMKIWQEVSGRRKVKLQKFLEEKKSSRKRRTDDFWIYEFRNKIPSTEYKEVLEREDDETNMEVSCRAQKRWENRRDIQFVNNGSGSQFKYWMGFPNYSIKNCYRTSKYSL